jgi:hypothetical protein
VVFSVGEMRLSTNAGNGGKAKNNSVSRTHLKNGAALHINNENRILVLGEAKQPPDKPFERQ